MLGIVLVMRRRGSAGEVVDVCDGLCSASKRGQRVDNIVLDQFETVVLFEMADILTPAGDETVEADDRRTVVEQTVAKVRPDETCAARNQGDLLDSGLH
jgi:hypothetical protein